ncbi:RraA family protein [Palleronia caenipelagi]|uniref:RraA family protein n=1 Tax=Palleronia caenipelagi TaxID=2489174 RepID=A0A547Q6K6_9RHOB|nr:RraA family protein [Palleronia caenipelagi]TRD22018.1 RraA family protein [Palleronia caenipelagi]
MNDALLDLLRRVGTPSVCNSLTAKIAVVAPPTEPADVIRARRMECYRHMAEGPRPALAVLGHLDCAEAVGAFWGEINTTIHQCFGLSGALTNGVMRDLDDMADGFPVIAGSVEPSHGFVHVLDIGASVTVFGLTVDDGNLVHADRHGAVVIPEAHVAELDRAIHKRLDTEALILGSARQPDFDFEAAGT